MNNEEFREKVIIELEQEQAIIRIAKEKIGEKEDKKMEIMLSTFYFPVLDERVFEIIEYFAANYSISYFGDTTIDDKQALEFRDITTNNSLSFIIHQENQKLGLFYINFLTEKHNEERIKFYERTKKVMNINIALSTSSSYYEQPNDTTVNYVLYAKDNLIFEQDLDFANDVLKECIFRTFQNGIRMERENIFIIWTEEKIITIPKLLFFKIAGLVRPKRLMVKKEGMKNENGRIS